MSEQEEETALKSQEIETPSESIEKMDKKKTPPRIIL